MSQEQDGKHNLVEIIIVSGDVLLDTIKKLLNEVGVRRIVVRKKDGEVLADIPLFLGFAGLIVFRFWALVPIVAGFLADYSVEVTREGRPSADLEEVHVEGQEEVVADVAEDIVVVQEEPVRTTPSAPTTPAPIPSQPRRTADDLTQINGIGPKVAGLLKESGITTFDQLAAVSVADLQKILDQAGPRYRIVDPTNWSQQAAEMVTGKE